MRRASSLRAVLLALGLSVLVAGVVMLARGEAQAQDENQPEAPSRDEPGDVNEDELTASGEELFNTSCQSCHGLQGEGTEQGPNIQQVGELGADFMLRTGRMPLAQPGPQAPEKPVAYTDAEIRALVEYVGAFGDGPAIPDVDIEGADLANGGELFRANCQPCHNASGIGGALSYGDHAPALTSVEPTQVVEAMRFGPGQMPVFGPDVFDDSDANDIAKYVDYLHRPEDPGGFGLGHSGPAAEGFVAWLFGIVILLWAVRWITKEHHPYRWKKATAVDEAGTAGNTGVSGNTDVSDNTGASDNTGVSDAR
jgi:ubiquinol-cytochrome c reductase cytochrome c subunit